MAPGGTVRSNKVLGGEQVEGVRAVRELLTAGRRKVYEVWVARAGAGHSGAGAGDSGAGAGHSGAGAGDSGAGAGHSGAGGEVEDSGSARPDATAEILHAADAAGVPVRVVDSAALHRKAVTDAPQGVVARAAPLPESSLDELCRSSSRGQLPAQGPPPFLVILDGVTDPGNIGALARTALSAGVTGMVLPRHRSAHITPAAAKAAAGAIEHLSFAVVPGIPAVLTRLAESEVWSVGLDPEAPVGIFDVDLLDGPVALVLGAEGRGLSRLTARRCDLLASIPHAGPLGSLNVAAAGAVACFEVVRRRLGAGSSR